MRFVRSLSIHFPSTFWVRERPLKSLFVRATEVPMHVLKNLAVDLAAPEWTGRSRQMDLSMGYPLVQVLVAH
jgi:hypothetical protein